jgi:hypothetical protein
MADATEIKYEVDEEIGFYLDQLRGGLYGKNRTQVLRMLVRDQIVLLKEKGRLNDYEKVDKRA